MRYQFPYQFCWHHQPWKLLDIDQDKLYPFHIVISPSFGKDEQANDCTFYKLHGDFEGFAGQFLISVFLGSITYLSKISTQPCSQHVLKLCNELLHAWINVIDVDLSEMKNFFLKHCWRNLSPPPITWHQWLRQPKISESNCTVVGLICLLYLDSVLYSVMILYSH